MEINVRFVFGLPAHFSLPGKQIKLLIIETINTLKLYQGFARTGPLLQTKVEGILANKQNGILNVAQKFAPLFIEGSKV